jgi:UDP-glucose 4-epimerase
LKRISIQGSGKQSRAFIHVDAMAKILKDIPFSKVPSGTYNLAMSNYSVLELVDVYKELIPELEFIFLDQHLEMRNFNLDTNLRLSKHLELPKARALKTEIEEFLKTFAF